MNFLDQLLTVSKSKEINRVLLSKCKDKAVKSFYADIDKVYVEEAAKDDEAWLNMVFLMKSGEKKMGYLSSLSELNDGDVVDKSTIEVIELEKDGKLLKPRYDGEVSEDE